MKCSAYFGEITEQQKNNWKDGEYNWRDVIKEPICLIGKGNALLYHGSDYFDDKIKVDWGSFAWKCSPSQILSFLCDFKTTLSWLINDEEELIKDVKNYMANKENAEFGVLFIEEI